MRESWFASKRDCLEEYVVSTGEAEDEAAKAPDSKTSTDDRICLDTAFPPAVPKHHDARSHFQEATDIYKRLLVEAGGELLGVHGDLQAD
eukprot:Skav233340  [mRNA]  locus=scaffold394:142212:143671:+ [translate_table: standard]